MTLSDLIVSASVAGALLAALWVSWVVAHRLGLYAFKAALRAFYQTYDPGSGHPCPLCKQRGSRPTRSAVVVDPGWIERNGTA